MVRWGNSQHSISSGMEEAELSAQSHPAKKVVNCEEEGRCEPFWEHIELGEAEAPMGSTKGCFDISDKDSKMRLPCGVIFFCPASMLWWRRGEEECGL